MSARAWRSAFIAMALLCAVVALTWALVAHAGTPPRCDVVGVAPLTAPDNACTPGQYEAISRKNVCDGDTPRPTLPTAVRRRLLADYGVPAWSGTNGELDHRVPLFLGGLTTKANLWPEAGHIPNPKDRLELAVYRRVCFGDPAPMRVRTAVRIFLSDWRHAYVVLVRHS